LGLEILTAQNVKVTIFLDVESR